MIDFKLDSEGDLKIRNGDFIFDESDQQNIQDIIENAQGDYKSTPFVGVNAQKYLSGSKAALERNIKIQLRNDGFQTDDIVADFDQSGELNIFANAQRN
jgi:hypothetical protein